MPEINTKETFDVHKTQTVVPGAALRQGQVYSGSSSSQSLTDVGHK